MLKDFARTSPVSFFALPVIIIGLLLSSYLMLSTLFDKQVEAKQKYLGRELDMAASRVLQQVEEFKNEIPYVSDADDFGQVFDERSASAARLRFRLKRIAARYRSFIDTLIVYNRSHMYFVHASKDGVTEEGYRPLTATALPLQFTPATKFIHISGNKSLSLIPVSWDSSKVHVAVLLDLFELIKKESDMQFIGEYGLKLIFSEYQGTELSAKGELIKGRITLPSATRMKIVGEILDGRRGNMEVKMGENGRFLSVFAPLELFNEKFGLIFMISEEDYIAPIQLTIAGILFLYLIIIVVIVAVFIVNIIDIGKKNKQLEDGKNELSRLLAQQTLLLEYGDSFAYTLSPDGRLQYASRNLSALTGYTFEQWRDNFDSLVLPGEANEKGMGKRASAVRLPGVENAYILEIKHANGHTKIFEFREKPFFNPQGEPESIPGTARDITQAHRTRKSILQLLAVLNAQLEASADAILILDEKLKVITFNSHFIGLFGIDKPLKTEMPLREFKSYMDKAFNENDWWEKTEQQINASPEFTLTTERNTGERILEIYTSPIKSRTGEKYGRLWAFSDITPRKLELEELREAKRLADVGAREKENFLSTMSHEIRTPLNAIVGFSELLLNETPLEEQKEYLLPLKYSADSLLALINDILDLSKIESGSIVFMSENCDVRDRLLRLTQIFKMKAEASGVQLIIAVSDDFPQQVLIDITRFDQIIINLLSNSVKFTHSGQIEISVKMGDVSGDNRREMLVSVTDTGIGISEENLKKIFKSFYQADSNTTRKYGGTGLGLAITRQLIELQGGYIRAESLLGSGSTFFFMLPFEIIARDAVNHHPSGEVSVSLENVKVLLVEDNPFNQKVAERFLKINGALVATADCGQQAIELFQKEEFHIVLLDLQMPDIDGFQVAKHMRRNTTSASYLPIIALTADAQTETREKAAACQIDDILLKPFDHKVLSAKISGLLKLHGIKP